MKVKMPKPKKPPAGTRIKTQAEIDAMSVGSANPAPRTSAVPTRMMIYSTLQLLDGAVGSQSMFTVPYGHDAPQMSGPHVRCPTCGNIPRLRQTEEHTNITQAGQFGSAIGEANLKTLRLVTPDGRKFDGYWNVRVGGRRIAGGSLFQLFDEKPFVFPDLVLVARTDTFELTIGFDSPLKLETPVNLKAELWADTLL